MKNQSTSIFHASSLSLSLPLAFSVLALALAGCRTTKDVLNDYEVNATLGNYPAVPVEAAKLAEKNDDTRLLWHLLAGAGYYMADDKAKARAQFDDAEAAFAKNDQTSVFAQGGEGALAMMTNDRAFTYDGGGIDRVFTCLYKGIDFMCEGSADNARVELNRAAQYQANWLYARRRDIAAADAKMQADAAAYAKKQQAQPQGDRNQQTAAVLSDATFAAQIQQQCNFNPATSGNLDLLKASDYMNAYALHVTGVFRWLNRDAARNELRDAAAFAAGNPAAARDYAEIEKGVRPQNQVWIWIEDGLCPTREEWRVDLPLGLIPGVGNYVIYAGMALPYLRERTWGAAQWNVQAGAQTVPCADLANVDKLVKTEYDVYMRGALAREITRTVVKVGTQAALGAIASNSGDWKHQLALRAAQVGVATWARSTTAADLRSWTALPKSVKAVRVDRPADGRIDVIADSQRIQLTLPAGNSMVFLRKPGPQALPVVKQVTFQ